MFTRTVHRPPIPEGSPTALLTQHIIRMLDNVSQDTAQKLKEQVSEAYNSGDALIPLLATIINKLDEQERISQNLIQNNEVLRNSISNVSRNQKLTASHPAPLQSQKNKQKPRPELYTLQTTKILDTNKFQKNKRHSDETFSSIKSPIEQLRRLSCEFDAINTYSPSSPSMKSFSPSHTSTPTTPKKRFSYKPDGCEQSPKTPKGYLSSPSSPKKVHFDINDHYNDIHVMSS
ncbi:glycerol-3-phosphate dehydrogenase [Acrasis kona]|uniref:Glycerol-3-phosphate dehydrogenase n=1 Tax=Acrasis kona TaxID=1008807 RepID=A0AAW2YKA1_9EUKA